MKTIKIQSLSSSGLLIVEENNAVYKQYPFEGFNINNDLSHRHYFDSLIGKTI